MSNSSSDFPWGTIFVIGLVALGIMWLCDAGPFEKSYTPTPTYNHSANPNGSGNSNGSNVSFGSAPAGSYTVNASSRDGIYTCRVTVRDGMAYINGSSQGVNIYEAGYGDPGAYWCFWGSVIVYF